MNLGASNMNRKVFSIIISLIILNGCTPHKDFRILKGPYLGQKPPGMTPEVFAPGVISTEYFEHGISFHPEGNALYFTRRITSEDGNQIYYMKVVNGMWSEPEPAPFSAPYRESSPNFSPDGKRLFFNSRRPLPENVSSPHTMNVWIVQKNGSDWKEPEILGSPIMEHFPMFVTQAKNGTIYFTGNVERGIYKSDFNHGKYEIPVRLPDVINAHHWAGHPFIDPDERYLLFDSNVDDKGTKNLYVSFKDEKCGWSESININRCEGFPEHAAIPHVSFDGKYLFFSSQGDIYWVDARIVQDLKPTKRGKRNNVQTGRNHFESAFP
jgi:Tol biopolymer transport system component